MEAFGISQSGKCSDVVASRNRFDTYQRRYFSPTKRRTAAQRRAGSAFGKLSAHWDKLTEEQRQVWRADARQTSSRRRMGKSHRLIGSLLYQKLNYPRVNIGLEPLTAPSKRPQFNPNPVGALTITNAGGAIALKLSVPERPAEYTMVFGSPPCKAGRSYCSNFSFLGLLPAPVAGVSDITTLYRKKHGLPPVGWRVFIITVQQVNGWRDDPQRTEADFQRQTGSSAPATAPPNHRRGPISPKDTLRIPSVSPSIPPAPPLAKLERFGVSKTLWRRCNVNELWLVLGGGCGGGPPTGKRGCAGYISCLG